MLKLLGALLILSVGVFSALVSVQYEKKRLTVVDGWIDLILYIRGQIDCYLLPIGDILSGGDRALFEACMSPSNAADLIASTIYEATRPSTVVVTQPAVVTPAPVVVTPAPVVVQQPVVTGHYETRTENVWVEGRYVDQVVNGVVQRVWQPGHYEQRQTQVWVSH